jgi:hypothetical protein
MTASLCGDTTVMTASDSDPEAGLEAGEAHFPSMNS